MEIYDTAEDRAFRQEVRDFIRANLPAEIKRVVEAGMFIDLAMQRRWHRKLLERGWAAPSWPREQGGTGWTLKQQYIFEHEMAVASAPRQMIFGPDMVGPLIVTFGSEQQKQRYLPKILRGEETWCQGFSEPGAGSDLAALQCRAVRDGDDFVINGTKIWQTSAVEADMMFGLFRTDSSGKKQEGITVFLVDMKSKGLSLRPIKLIDGSVECAQIFFDDVRVPVANQVGELNKGWSCAKYLLGIERLGIAEVARSKAMLERLKRLAAAETVNGAALVDDPWFAAAIVEIETELKALAATEYRFLFDPEKKGELGAEASILKLRGTVVQQRLTELTMQAAGPYAAVTTAPQPGNWPSAAPDYAAAATEYYLNMRKISIYGGSNEIQRNIVAKAVLRF